MIKKILVVLIIIFGFFTVVFAENSDPFANVKGIALTDEDMAMVEGEGIFPVIILIGIVSIGGCAYKCGYEARDKTPGNFNPPSNPRTNNFDPIRKN